MELGEVSFILVVTILSKPDKTIAIIEFLAL